MFLSKKMVLGCKVIMFDSLLTNASLGVNEIKLKELLTIRSEYYPNSKISTLFPPVEIGSITLVDQIVLLSLGQLIDPEKLVEIGTYLGYSTSVLAMNLKNTEIFTVDLPKAEEVDNLTFDEGSIYNDGVENDNFLRKKQQVDGEVYLKELSESELNRVNLIKHDSTKLDFKQTFDDASFVFIDGGHEHHIIEQDTINARSIIKRGVIVWHDFGSNIHGDVTEYLHSLTDRKIFHVMGSLCAFELIGYGA